MGYEVQAQTCQPMPGQQLIFTFQNQPQTWVVGLGHFFLSYGPTTNHWIETLSITLQTNQNGNSVDVTVGATMTDHTGHMLDMLASYITVVCIAQTGNADPTTFLLNKSGVTPTQSQQVPLPGSGDCPVLETCLSGLSLGYNNVDHMFQRATAGCGISSQGGEAEGLLNATANIWDSTGHEASTAAIDAGVLASVDQAPGFMVQPVPQARTSVPVPPVLFKSPVSQAVALIQSFNVQYASGDHGVQWLKVGCEGLTVSGNLVTLGPCEASTTDGHGNYSAWWESSVDLLVVAVPPPASG